MPIENVLHIILTSMEQRYCSNHATCVCSRAAISANRRATLESLGLSATWSKPEVEKMINTAHARVCELRVAAETVDFVNSFSLKK